jgi:hypothetical protein
MPPVYKHVNSIKTYTGLNYLNFQKKGLDLIYIPDVISFKKSTKIFDILTSEKSPLEQHEYLGNFNRIIRPARLTYAEVPDRPFYRYKGKDLSKSNSKAIAKVGKLIDCPYNFDSYIVNGYRYNGKDCIAPHVDDEKFLMNNNYPGFGDIPAVFTYTFLDDVPMKYCFGDPDTGIGYTINARHGSLIIQGSVLHEILPNKGDSDSVGRVSVTLRKLIDSCDKHGSDCRKINCPHIYGPSNYLYYSCKNCLTR